MRKFHYENQLSKEWCFEIDLKKRWGFGFLIAPAAIHFRVWRLWFSLVHEGYLYITDDLIKAQPTLLALDAATAARLPKSFSAVVTSPAMGQGATRRAQ